MTPEQKRIIRFVLMGLSISAGILTPFCIVLTQFAMSGGLSVNTCYSEELAGKTDQEIADLLGVPLVTLDNIPPGLPERPSVTISFTDTDCQLRILYGTKTEGSIYLEIIVFDSANPTAGDGWMCREDPSGDFETACFRNVEYLGKRYGTILRAPYSLHETQNLTAFVTVSGK